jgi:enoyl-CoA hydratase/carnithine racemase
VAVDYEKKGKIAIFTLNRPKAMNSLSWEVYQELHDAVADFFRDDNLWVGIVTGAGEKAFCAGADLKGWKNRIAEGRTTTNRSHSGLFTGYLWSEESNLEMWKPLIAAVNGYCLGGGLELALSCDIRIAASHARFGMPEVTRGRLPGYGGVQRLSWMLNWSHAAEILLTGKQYDAEEAYRIGLVNRVVPLDKLMPTAMEWAEIMTKTAPLAARAIRQVMVRSHGMVLKDGMALERSLGSNVLASQDFAEGVQAFLERREPDWRAQ